MKKHTLTILLERLVLLSLFVFASCGAKWTWNTINGTCASSCLCSVDKSLLGVGNCSGENIDQEQLSEQIDSLLSSNLTNGYLTNGHLTKLVIFNTPLMHVPRSVCRLTTLQGLYLFHNPLTRLPDNCFTNLIALTLLTVEFSHIAKLQDRVFDGLHKLKKLYLDNNNITVLQDGIFDRLRMLETLFLNNNSISSIGSRAFDGLSKLLFLTLQTNNITQLQDGIFDGLDMLKTLDLSDNRISSIGSKVFVGLSKLQSLYLNANHITQLHDGIFNGLRMLQTLDVSDNRISSIGSQVFGGSPMNNSLTFVNMSGNRVQARVFDGLHKLEKLYLNNNNITKLQDEIFDGLSMLDYLHLENNRISSIGLRTFDGLSKLEGLNIQGNNITELQNGIFDSLRMLMVLKLDNNCISFIGLRAFGRLSELQILYLGANHITQLPDGIFDGLRALKTLDVSDNRISSIGSRVFDGYAMAYSLNYVNFSHNSIQTLDSWPIYMGINQNVKIDLSDNNIHRFTDMMRWKENCGERIVHFDLLLDRNPITVYISDLLSGWDMNISSTWCSSPPIIEAYSEIINYAYFDCGCVDFVIFSLQLPINMELIGAICNNRTLFLNKDNTVRLDQFVCELTERCPSGCRCVHRPANATIHIYCSNTNLTVLPLELPELPKSYTKYKLDFSNNQMLRRLEHRDYFVNTSSLDVSNSDIQVTESADVWNIILKILQVNLYGNKLTSFPQSIISSNITAEKLNIAHNLWDCSCDNKWMSRWLKSIADRLTDKVLCYNPSRLHGKSIIQTNDEEFCVDPAAKAVAEASK